ncbi:alpha-ketoglutarate-dependent dioxygenase AlkB [Cerasicoccus frondis]|uniref:alpha-ketoglutarate-dependent dioxygenase AlkB n=1 Tax=Cerasicoccus frondis TaxID=490090 RepID=UPI002852BE5D|nr:alpha-ketoglutarate-dependent dioxygenase AlkB [Cerasicoccus frondis]
MQALERIALDADNALLTASLPVELLPNDATFETFWSMHPEHYHEVRIHGRVLPTPRWQQAYGRSYIYSGFQNNALPMPGCWQPYASWCQEQIDARLNGLLVNWYDAAHGHYIGKHRDSPNGLIADAPIVTISLGATRTFRLRPWQGSGYLDFTARHGSVFVLPAATNRAWTHEVTKKKSDQGRRISLTFRAFAD